MELSLSYLQSIIDYNPETGIFTWKHRSDFDKAWNNKHAGKNAGSISHYLYVETQINKQKVKLHRLAWFMFYGKWPLTIDHINGIRSDNRIINLRSCTHQDNHKNTRKKKNNKSGITGVYFVNSTGRWAACINVNYRTIGLGSYFKIEEAADARKQAELKYNFHPNHGK